jgi:hypothetical protein
LRGDALPCRSISSSEDSRTSRAKRKFMGIQAADSAFVAQGGVDCTGIDLRTGTGGKAISETLTESPRLLAEKRRGARSKNGWRRSGEWVDAVTSRSAVVKKILVLGWCLALTSLFGADDRPQVYFAVTRMADADTRENSWIAMGRKPPVADDAPNCWYWYPRYGNPFFAVVTPVTVSDFAIFGVRFYWGIKDAMAVQKSCNM